MKEIRDYKRVFSEFVGTYFPEFGKPLEVKVGQLPSLNYVISNGKAHPLNDDDIKIMFYKDGSFTVYKDKISALFPIGNLQLIIEKNYEGNEWVYLQKTINFETKLKGKVLWDGDEFVYLKKESKYLADYLNNEKPKLNYKAVFDFDNNQVRIKKELDESCNLKEEIENFDTSEYERYIQKYFKH